MSTTTIKPFPELRDLARSEADTLHYVLHGRHISGERGDAWVAAHLTLLCDLTRPASRDAVCRLVAMRIGWRGWEVAQAEYDYHILVALIRTVGLPGPDRWEPHPPWDPTLARIVHALWPEVTS